MTSDTLLALMIYAIDRDALSLPVEKVIELFRKDATSMKKNYTDPNDELLYIKGMEEVDDIEFFTDYVLCYGKSALISGLRDYGRYNEDLAKYNHKK